MKVQSLRNKRVAIWGFGREGVSTYLFLRQHLPDVPLTILTEAPIEDEYRQNLSQDQLIRVAENHAIDVSQLIQFDIVVKSPGISPYREAVQLAKHRGVLFTTALNIYFAENPDRRVIAVTGTKGKSTTTTLIERGLTGCDFTVRVAGNIGIPVLSLEDHPSDFDVIEVSSYQATDLIGHPEVALLVDLFPEHLDWHGSVEVYYTDKLKLLRLAKRKVINACDKNSQTYCSDLIDTTVYNSYTGFHSEGRRVLWRGRQIGLLENEYLARPHNISNICAALAVIEIVGGDPRRAFSAIATFQGLTHRQQLLGEKHGVLYVNDSISTIPESTLAAIEVWDDRDITLLLGGHDRGIDYSKLVTEIYSRGIHRVILLPDSGPRIGTAIRANDEFQGKQVQLWNAKSLEEAVEIACQVTPTGGVILLSPAAPSYGYFRNHEERGKIFANLVGLPLER